MDSHLQKSPSLPAWLLWLALPGLLGWVHTPGKPLWQMADGYEIWGWPRTQPLILLDIFPKNWVPDLEI